MKKNKLPSLVTILILTLITVLMWIGLNIYRALSQKPPPPVPEEVLNPLTPTLDIDSLTKIQSRIFLDDSQIPEFTISKSPAPIPIATATPVEIASPSAIPTPEAASGSGAL